MSENKTYQGAEAVFLYRIGEAEYTFSIDGHKVAGKSADDWKIGLALTACQQIMKENDVTLDKVKMTLKKINLHEEMDLAELTTKYQ